MSTRSGRHFRVEKEPSEATGKETDRSKTMDHDSSTRQHRDSANVDTKSVKSKSTKSSSIYGSSTSSAAMKARAKVESARALLAYANKEAELLRQKAALDADMLILQSEKVAAAATAEAAVYDEDQSLGSHDELRDADIHEVNSNQRTSDYIQHHFSDQAASRNPIITQTRANYRQETEDLAKYLIRKDLVSSRLIIFDEKPENYRAWKASFRDVIRDLNLLPREELDLLIKWLGGKSSLHAKRLRSAQVTNPQVGLDMVWQRLDECYGAPEVVEQALLRKVDDFPKMNTKDNTKIRELGDVLLELECAMRDGTLPGLSYLDSAGGVKRIVEKLPPGLQDKWRSKGARYKEDYNVTFPPFSVFSRFVRQEAKILNDPSFEVNSSAGRFAYPERVKTHITGMIESSPASGQCPIHKKPHPLLKCRAFLSMPLEERKACLMENRLCFRCMATSDHVARNCKVSVKCAECGSVRHNTALHVDQAFFRDTQVTKGDNGGEQNSSSVTSKCTEICGDNLGGRSCSKVCQVKVYTQRKEHEAIKVYAVLDEQSNRSLAKPQLFDALGITSTTTPYTLRTCSGIMETAGRRANNLMISSIDDKVKFHLPALIECEMIPDDRQEIPTPDIANHFSHLKPIANKIPPVDPQVQILLLLGRDVLRAHKVREHINGPHDAPYAQRLDLGWVIVGEVCLGTSHQPKHHNVFKTSVYSNGRTSLMEPCSNMIQVKERIDKSQKSGLNITSNKGSTGKVQFGTTVFDKTNEDEKEALSIEDNIFLDIMDRHVHQDENGSWVAPLPFRPERRRLPNNRIQAQKRLYSLRKSLEKDSTRKNQFAEFVQKMLDNDHAEPAPPLEHGKECWYLPIFGVHHPQKPDQIRVVFDSSAEFEDISLNSVLLSGPDLNNPLLGVLMRFRKDPIAFSADIQQMFYNFLVEEDHRDFLRFLWFKDNDMTKEICEYRMKVHVFGNSPSPSVATYCLRRAAQKGEKIHGSDAKQYVERNFYVDDGLSSSPTPQGAIDLLKRTRAMLAESNINLHKIASNSGEVVKAFDVDDRAKGIKDLDLSSDPLPIQRSLGMLWDLDTDTFTFSVSSEDKAFTKRGVLSVVNSLYDPLGLTAPITIKGKALLRELSSEINDWDEPLSFEGEVEWTKWKESLKLLEDVHVPRCIIQSSLSLTKKKELCIFSDASTFAIGAVAYIRVVNEEGNYQVGFLLGKAKLAPKPAHTIPRLELCAAVLAVELYEYIKDEIDLEIDTVRFFTDSKIVLGYINNTTRRFYVYVSNRVNRIRQSTRPEQLCYVATKQNPADLASRSIAAHELQDSMWFTGPEFLSRQELLEVNNYDLVQPEADSEVRPVVTTMLTKASNVDLGAHRFERFSNWKALLNAVGKLLQIAKSFKKIPGKPGKGTWKCSHTSCGVDEFSQARITVLRSIQQDAYKEELDCIKRGRALLKGSSLRRLNPQVDKHGLLRVGGRLSDADLTQEEKHPVIVPPGHVSTIIIRHYHESVAHQGRHITEGAIRAAGFWVVGGKRRTCNVIKVCVTCKKLRGKEEFQLMADLPADRVTCEPPFTSVGVDVFGPWQVLARRTRGASANNKRWAVIFSCMYTRAVHLEVIESLSASSFINALRRFFAIRGPARVLRSDRGTNFVGACKELGIIAETRELRKHLLEKGCVWLFNPPHSSHMGGSWERMIGIARKILNAMLLQSKHTRLTHEILCTFLAEVMAIMNARPLVPVSCDPDQPTVLTPAMLLTQKVDATSAPAGNFDTPTLHKKHWKQVQCLAETFWKRWRRDYLSSFQERKKWVDRRPNLKIGNVVLLKDNQVSRNEWPLGIIDKVYPDADGSVRKIDVRVAKDGKAKVFLRPITQVILLLSDT